MKVFFDGGCRPNPGRMEIAVVAAGRTTIRRDLAEGTSVDAEWLALIHALEIARSLGAADVVLLGDALGIVRQAGGLAPCRGSGPKHLTRFRSLVAEGEAPRLRYVKRSQNLAGIALARLHPR